MLKVEHLTFCYGTHQILSDISFEIPSGCIAALLGPNGSGKTTLLRCLDQFLIPKSGTILLGEKPIHLFSSNALARKIAYMPQRTEVTGLTVFDTILLGRKPYISWKPSFEDYERVEKTLRRLGLLDKALRSIDQLSGGELQKVSLGRIFVQEPELILPDEPTSALDLRNRLEIMRHLTHFVRRHQAAVVMSIHDLNDAFRVANRLLFLKEGVLYADVTPETVTEEILTEVYGIPLEIYTHSGKKMVLPKDNSGDDIHSG